MMTTKSKHKDQMGPYVPVSKLKRMMMANLTTPLWLQRSMLWNLVALQARPGIKHVHTVILPNTAPLHMVILPITSI